MDIDPKVVVIGGSAGSLPMLTSILNGLPEKSRVPIIIVLHRQRNVQSEMERILGAHSPNKKIIEPEDKQPINVSCIYLAPQNYHLLIEDDLTFSLDYSEPVLYSRPSINVTFESAARVFKTGVTAVLLSGANNDGSLGISTIISLGGNAIVQDPSTAEYPTMPQAALHKNPLAQSQPPDKIVSFVRTLVY